ncbi:MAG: outer membrane lipoprotein-sorting protein [Desulfurivibrionaceae bacterium]|nr:outer membrane lipoprotein-sorting protein [Desulfurivibrionaceae bacterium]
MTHLKRLTAAIFCLLWTASTAVATPSVDDIVKRVEANLSGETAFMRLTMVVRTKRGKRTMKMESWAKGRDRSFIRITYPGKDSGITFLKIDNAMWQYVPRIEKTIKIPASMMLQSWMGSDFTNDDLVRESSISEDYHAALAGENETEYLLDLHPREEAPVVWGRIRMHVSKEYLLPARVSYYDEEGRLVRVLDYLEVKPFGERHYPTRWRMLPQSPDREGHLTEVIIEHAVFDAEIDEAYFTKRALKRFSQ